MAGFSNRGGGSGDVTIIVNPNDEQTEYPAAALPALVDPQIYTFPATGVTITAGAPRIARERYAYGTESFFWYPHYFSFGFGLDRIAMLHMNRDQNDQYLEATGILRSHDGGLTFDESLDVDTSITKYARFWDAPTGRVYEWDLSWFPDPPGQARDFKSNYGWWANGGRKYVNKPWGSRVRGLPTDINPLGTTTRHMPYKLWAESRPCRMANGDLAMVMDGIAVGDTLHTGYLVKSTDDGENWDFVSVVGEAELGPSENALHLLDDGRLLCVFRNSGSLVGMGAGCVFITSTDATGTAWNEAFFPVLNTAVAAPSIIKLDNGIRVVATGRAGIYLNVNTDGGGASGSVWDRWYATAHQDLYETAGGVSEATASILPGLIRKQFNPTENNTGTFPITQVGPNRIQCMYDSNYADRHPIGTPYGHPHQALVMDLDITLT